MTTRRQFLRVAGLSSLAAVVLPHVGYASPRVYQSRGYAIEGYDPVAYFTDGKATKGSKDFAASWDGATFLFASAANRSAFEANPDRFAPQYGGYCAWAVAQGYTAPIDVDAWHIENDKLYLNYSNRILRRWRRDIPGNIAKGNANWPGVLG